MSAVSSYRRLGIFSNLALMILLILKGGEAAADTAESITYRVGSFFLEWNGKKNSPGMKVYHQSDLSHLVWETVPGGGFIAAGYGITKVSEKQGSFEITENLLQKWEGQSIDSIEHHEGELLIHGKIDPTQDGESKSGIPYTVRFYSQGDKQLGFEVQLIVSTYFTAESYRVQLKYSSTKDEHFFGFGEQFTYFDLKGKKVPILIQEQGIGRGRQPLTSLMNQLSKGSGGSWSSTYAAVPHYISSRSHSLFLENSEYSIFDLSDDNQVVITLFGPKMKGRILYGKDPLSLIETYTEYSGRMKPLPAWTQEGAVVAVQGGSSAVMKAYRQLKEAGTPLAAFWIQDWVGSFKNPIGSFLWWNWEVDREAYPLWETLVADLRAQGVRTLSYVNPFLADISKKKEMKRNLFEEALNQGNIVVRHRDGIPYLMKFLFSEVLMIDLGSATGCRWIKNIIRDQMISTGISGWMADFGESFPMDDYFGDPVRNAFAFHNEYAEEWARVQKEVIQEAGLAQEAVVFMRAGYTRSPGLVSLFWLGDQLTSWDDHDGIKTALKGLLSSGISGYSLNHSDIGGYTAVGLPPFDYHRTQELFLRWTELNAFTSFFRTHEGNKPAKNHQFNSNPETLAHFTRFSKVFRSLASYRKYLMEEANLKGYPLVRSLFLHYPEDPVTYGLTQEFLLGSELLVAPVLDPGVQTVSVYFPKGEWQGLFSKERIDSTNRGSWVKVWAPLGQPAVFIKKNSKWAEEIFMALRKNGIE